MFIPKGGTTPGADGHAAAAAQLRPLTLSNSSQNLVAKALGASLERVALALVHPAQSGVVRGRRMLSDVLEMQAALKEATMFGMAPSAMVLFDVAVAFPSAEWEWIWSCLDAIGMPGWLARGLRLTHESARMTVMFNGEVFHDIVISLRRGIKQGCPASSALLALFLDPIARRLVAVLPPLGYALTCFVDDLAAALGNALVGLRLLLPVLLEMLLAAGLALHAGKTRVVNFSASTDFDIRRRIADILVVGAFMVARSGVYLRVPVGPDSVGHEFDQALIKYQAHCAYVRCVPGFVAERLCAHQAFGVSVLLFLAQFADLLARANTIEGAVLAGQQAAPMYAIIASTLAALASDSAAVSFQPVALQYELELYDAWLAEAQDHDEALLAPPRTSGSRTVYFNDFFVPATLLAPLRPEFARKLSPNHTYLNTLQMLGARRS